MQRFGFLYGGYSFQYWETVDMMRKLLIGAIPVFVAVQPQGSLQAVIGQVAASQTSVLDPACTARPSCSHPVSLPSMCLMSGYWPAVLLPRSAGGPGFLHQSVA